MGYETQIFTYESMECQHDTDFVPSLCVLVCPVSVHGVLLEEVFLQLPSNVLLTKVSFPCVSTLKNSVLTWTDKAVCHDF